MEVGFCLKPMKNENPIALYFGYQRRRANRCNVLQNMLQEHPFLRTNFYFVDRSQIVCITQGFLLHMNERARMWPNLRLTAREPYSNYSQTCCATASWLSLESYTQIPFGFNPKPPK